MLLLSTPVAVVDGVVICSELDRYYKLCHAVACRIARSYGMMHLYEDLVQQGVIKLLECLKRYDGESGKFWTYAEYRVAGHILDQLRKETHSRNKKQYTYLPIESCPDLLSELSYAHNFALMCDMQALVLPERARTVDILEEAVLRGNNRETAEAFGVTESRVCQITSRFRRDNPDVFT
jgi:RNA polymerase sigma factor (sigma-70 family)